LLCISLIRLLIIDKFASAYETIYCNGDFVVSSKSLPTVFWLIIVYAVWIYCSGQLLHALVLAAVSFSYQVGLVVACVECTKQGMFVDC